MSRNRSTTTSTLGSTCTTASSLEAQIPGAFSEPGLSPTISSQLSLASRINERRAEYTRPHSVRIRVGSWNVAAFKGTELDLAGWFVRGKGVSESLSGLSLSDEDQAHREDVTEQEARWSKYRSTIPKNDAGVLPEGEAVGIYALGLQEVVDISSAAEALRPFTDPGPANKYKEAVEKQLPPGYKLVAERQLIGLLLLVWVSPVIQPQISWVSTTSVGTGLMGYMGNKGAVTARLVLGGTTRLVFINSHLSAGTGKTEAERRNWDAAQVVSRTRYDPITDDAGISHPGEKIGDEDFAFWFGDLNYRLEGIPPEDVRRLLMLHTRNEYDLSSKSEKKIDDEIGVDSDQRSQSSGSHHSISTSSILSAISSSTGLSKSSKDDYEYEADQSEDPASLQTTIDSLLPHDELLQHINARRMFHDGWREGPITFLPTYKYDRGTVGVFDTTEKKRGPSWCDRILYRTRADRLSYADMLREEATARERDEKLKAEGLDSAAHEEETLFEYDPDNDADDDFDDYDNKIGGDVEHVVTKDGAEDTIKLEYYITHQRVLSSDHKPIDAGFMLRYDGVVPELRSRVQQEVARELDKAENDGRPAVTMVVDGLAQDDATTFDGADFGKLRYDEPKFRTVTIANTGRSHASFGFAIRPQETPLTAPRWLTIRFDLEADAPLNKNTAPQSQDAVDWYASVPHVYSLAPGETCTVDLIADIATKDLIHDLNAGEHLDDVLVLRVKDGRDQFLAVRGVWQRSTHGHTLDKLLRIPEGSVRKLQNQHPEGKWKHRLRRLRGSSDEHTSGSIDHGNRSISDSDHSTGGRDSEDLEVKWSTPPQIFRLTETIEALIERVLAEWSMMGSNVPSDDVTTTSPPWVTTPGWPFAEASWVLDAQARRSHRVEINEALDTDEPFDNHFDIERSLPLSQRLEVFAETLLLLLSNMRGGIITPTLWTSLAKDYFGHPSRRSMKSAPQTNDEQRAAILEILSQVPKHSTTFLLLMASLTRMTGEIAGALHEAGTKKAAATSPGLGRLIRRLTTEAPEPLAVRKATLQRRYAEVFASVVVHDVGLGFLHERGSGQGEDEKRELLEIFLRTEG